MAKAKGEGKNKVIAYVRVSTDDQDTRKQLDQINEYGTRHGLHIPEENVISITMSSRKTTKERRIEELKERLKTGDTLIVSEMSRLGRSTFEMLDILENFLVPQKIDLIFIKEGINVRHGHLDPMSKMLLTILSLFYENERVMISRRTKDALAVLKARGIKLGKPRGLVQHSKLDPHVDKIKELLVARISRAGIARVLDSSRTNLNKYIKKHSEIMREVKATLAAKEQKKNTPHRGAARQK